MTNTVKEMANLLDKWEEGLTTDSQKIDKQKEILEGVLMSRLIINSLNIKHEERKEE